MICKRIHELEAALAEEIPKALVQLLVREWGKKFAGTLENLGNKRGITVRTALLPLRRSVPPVPSRFGHRMVEYVGYPVGQRMGLFHRKRFNKSNSPDFHRQP